MYGMVISLNYVDILYRFSETILVVIRMISESRRYNQSFYFVILGVLFIQCCSFMPRQPKRFNANRPFMFYIKENLNVLFIARVSKFCLIIK